MFRKSLAYTLILGVWVSGLSAPSVRADGRAWSSPYLSADEPDTRKLLADRTKFVQEMYQLGSEASSKVLESLNGLTSVQDRYQRETALTLERLRLVITLVGTDTSMTEPDRQAKVVKYQGQFHRIVGKAPMSLQNVAKMAEASLATEQITAAHGRIQAKFADTVKISGIPFAIENLDVLACGPLQPGVRPELRLPEREEALAAQAPPIPSAQRPTPIPPRPVTPNQPTPPQRPAPVPAPNMVLPQPVPSAPLPPAPPTTQWPELVKGSTDKYDFTADQRTAAENVLTQTQARATEHRKLHQPAYDEAAKLSDEDTKMKKLQELNKPLDSLYDQLQRRIESIASIEQRNKAAEKEKSPK